MSLRVRLAAFLAAAVFLAFLVAAGVSFFATQVALEDSLEEDLVQTATIIAAQEGGSGISLGPTLGNEVELGSSIQEFNAQGILIAEEGPDFTNVLLPGERAVVATEGLNAPQKHLWNDQTYLSYTLGTSTGAIRVARSTASNQDLLDGLQLGLIRFGVVAAGVAAVAGVALARYIIRPVTALTEVAEDIAETGKLERRIETERDDEVGRLAVAFNRMVAALATSRHQQHRLVQDASHELRTPLTSLRTNIEVLEQRGSLLDADQREELVGDIKVEVVELSELVAELVNLATDEHTAELAERVRFDTLVAEAVDRARRRHDWMIESELEPCEVIGRPGMLDRAVSNLLENAVKWSPDGEPIRVVLEAGTLTVHDRGPGIPANERDKVFERFFRTMDAQKKPGSGLGLAIVDQTVTSHGGEVFVLDSPDGGAAVGFRLPGVRLV